MRIKLGPTILFFIIYIWAYAIFNAVKADEPTITIPYTEKEMCKAFLKAEICEMSQDEQETYFMEMFRGLLEREFNKKEELDMMDICFKETEEGKIIPCKGMDI